MGVGILLRHPHFMLLHDSLYDTIRLWLFLGLIATGLLLVAANVARDRRAKHRRDPQLRAVALTVAQHDTVIRGGLAWRRSADVKMERLDRLQQSLTEVLGEISDAFREEGLKPPWEGEQPKPDLHVIKGGGAA